MLALASVGLATGAGRIELEGPWTVCDAGNASLCASPAAVPGTAIAALHAAGLAPDPVFG